MILESPAESLIPKFTRNTFGSQNNMATPTKLLNNTEIANKIVFLFFQASKKPTFSVAACVCTFSTFVSFKKKITARRATK